MKPSYREINYVLRPAKNIERKMMCEIFRRLGVFGDVKAYQYIGFGSIFFGDFILFHRRLGFNKMTSIEKHEEDAPRVEFNKPFACVGVKLGHSNEILREIPLAEGRSVVWLDYDHELAESVLNDVETFVSCCMAGSVIAVTVDVETKRLGEPKSLGGEEAEEEWPSENPVEQLKRLVGERNVPAALGEEHLRGDSIAETYRVILGSVLERALSARNAGRVGGKVMKCRQVFYFLYADGAEMMTVGWVVYEEGQEGVVERCAFHELEFYRAGAEAYRIDVPNLTYREVRALDKEFPEQGRGGAVAPVPEAEREKYRKVYRYFPNFTEGEL